MKQSIKYILFPLILYIGYCLVDRLMEPQIYWGSNVVQTLLVCAVLYCFEFQRIRKEKEENNRDNH